MIFPLRRRPPSGTPSGLFSKLSCPARQAWDSGEEEEQPRERWGPQASTSSWDQGVLPPEKHGASSPVTWPLSCAPSRCPLRRLRCSACIALGEVRKQAAAVCFLVHFSNCSCRKGELGNSITVQGARGVGARFQGPGRALATLVQCTPGSPPHACPRRHLWLRGPRPSCRGAFAWSHCPLWKLALCADSSNAVTQQEAAVIGMSFSHCGRCAIRELIDHGDGCGKNRHLHTAVNCTADRELGPRALPGSLCVERRDCGSQRGFWAYRLVGSSRGPRRL